MYLHRILLTSCILFHAAFAASVDSFETQELHTAEAVENAPKINWQPVWGNLEHADSDLTARHHVAGHEDSTHAENAAILPQQHDDVVDTQNVTEEIASEATLQEHEQRKRETDACTSDIDSGLQNLLKQSKMLLPLEKMRTILDAAATDSEVQAFLKLIKSSEYRAKVAVIRESRDYLILRDFSCKKLNLDLKYYADYIRTFFNIPEMFDVTVKQGSGIRGLLQDLRAVLPKEELIAMYKQLLEKDDVLSKAVTELKSNEFRQLLKNFRELPELKELHQMFAAVGVPFEELEGLVKTALGGQDMELDVEAVVINF